MFNVVILSGSLSPSSYTNKAVKLLEDELKSYDSIHYELFSSELSQLPFPGLSDTPSDFQKALVGKVKAAHGLIIATPEYHGSFSSLLKLVVENLGYPSALNGKPVALLGVAGGSAGATKSIEKLQSVCWHTGAQVLPNPVSISNSYSAFNESGELNNPKNQDRIASFAYSFTQYIKAASI